MGLADRFVGRGPGVSPSATPEVSCRRYSPTPGTKRCRHYVKGGACSLPDELMCIEWLKANGQDAPPSLPPVEERPAAQPGPAPSASPPPAPPDDEGVALIRKLSDDDVASFKALGVEVCLATADCGQIWLVPDYTGRDDRVELSARDAATLAAICATFPGARVTSFERGAPAEGE